MTQFHKKRFYVTTTVQAPKDCQHGMLMKMKDTCVLCGVKLPKGTADNLRVVNARRNSGQ